MASKKWQMVAAKLPEEKVALPLALASLAMMQKRLSIGAESLWWVLFKN